ncbi:MAG TPA: GNAT family N-acetyltransferase [Anaerolineales bacterium]|nr:GNAT family N-acetyltransferase [Anaerolineales bacterium]
MKRSLTTSRGEILLREADPVDAVQFRDLRLGALQDSPAAFSADYQRNLSYPPKHWEDMLTMHADEATIFLAYHEDNLIGMTGIARGGSPKTRHSATVWGVYVKPEWRGLHIAEGLIRSCFDWAKARGIVIAKLGVATVNEAAIRCYERCGFKTYGIEPGALFHEGRYYDFHMMSCSLNTELVSNYWISSRAV